jgi:hypothetical protein
MPQRPGERPEDDGGSTEVKRGAEVLGEATGD